MAIRTPATEPTIIRIFVLCDMRSAAYKIIVRHVLPPVTFIFRLYSRPPGLSSPVLGIPGSPSAPDGAGRAPASGADALPGGTRARPKGVERLSSGFTGRIWPNFVFPKRPRVCPGDRSGFPSVPFVCPRRPLRFPDGTGVCPDYAPLFS